MEYIEEGLKKFAENWDKLGSDSIAFPRLGCGNGGLDWNDVQPLMEKYLKNIPMQIYIYVDRYVDPLPEHMQVSEIEQWLNGENELEGYEKFWKKLRSRLAHDQGILLDNGINVNVDVTEDGLIINEEHKIEIKSEELCVFWNYVRDVGVILENEIPLEFQPFANVILKLMKSLQYIEVVFVSQNGMNFTGTSNAYQFVAG